MNALTDLFQGKIFNVVTLILALISLIVAAFGAYFARAALFPPRKQMSVLIKHPTSLLSVASSAISGIEVKHHSQVLADPYVVEVLIEFTGRHDIGSADFDQGRPIRFSVGSATLIDVLRISTQPQELPNPAFVVDGSSGVSIGPDLFKQQSKVEIQMLVDGNPDLQCNAHLINARILTHRGVSPQQQQSFERRGRRILISSVVAAAFASLFLASYNLYVLKQDIGSPFAKTFAGDVKMESKQMSNTTEIDISGNNFSRNSPLLASLFCEKAFSQTFPGKTDDRGQFRTVVHAGPLSKGARCGVTILQEKPKMGIGVANITVG